MCVDFPCLPAAVIKQRYLTSQVSVLCDCKIYNYKEKIESRTENRDPFVVLLCYIAHGHETPLLRCAFRDECYTGQI